MNLGCGETMLVELGVLRSDVAILSERQALVVSTPVIPNSSMEMLERHVVTTH